MQLTQIAIAHTPFDEKFGTPRQPGLVRSAVGRIELLPPLDVPEAVRGLEDFSHLWLIYEFHQIAPDFTPKPTVRPPRLGGNERVGVLASRSPFRPNRIGLSLVRLKEIVFRGSCPILHVEGVDLVNGTPIFDIKPYLPWIEAVPEARGGFAPTAPDAGWRVEFAPGVEDGLDAEFETLVREVVALDPRPAYREGEAVAEYGVSLAGRNVRWRVEAETRVATVFEVSG